MKKNNLGLVVCFLMIINISCGKLFYVETECREFSYHGEEYWFPQSVGENVIFVDASENEKIFTVVKKVSSHVTMYYTDSGCGCEDYSNMILTSGNDTIYLKRLSRYIYDQDAENAEDIVFLFNNEHSIFFETELLGIQDLTIDTIQINNCRVYEEDYDEGRRINKVYFAKGIGIVRYIMQDGTIWTNKDLTDHGENQLSSFDYSENVCE